MSLNDDSTKIDESVRYSYDKYQMRMCFSHSIKKRVTVKYIFDDYYYYSLVLFSRIISSLYIVIFGSKLSS